MDFLRAWDKLQEMDEVKFETADSKLALVFIHFVVLGNLTIFTEMARQHGWGGGGSSKLFGFP